MYEEILSPNPLVISILSTTSVIIGIIICFFGYRIFRFVLAVAGFILGASFIAGVASTLTESPDTSVIIIAGVAGGLIAALSLLLLYSAGVFLLGALFGVVMLSVISLIFNLSTNLLIYIIPAIICGVLALVLKRFMIILITSLVGAWVIIVGVLYIIDNDMNPLNPEFITNITEIETYRIIVSWIALSGLGFIVQYLIFPRKNIITQNQDVSEKDQQRKN